MFELRAQIADRQADVEDLAESMVRLRRELLEFDVEQVRFERAEPPPGAKSGSAITLGSLIIALAGSRVLEQVIHYLAAWMNKKRERTIRLELGDAVLELNGASGERERELIAQWVKHVERMGERSSDH